jgi:hypothetical protein
MTLQEFAALKVGDQIENPMNASMAAVGTVTEVMPNGVRLTWGDSSMPFFYSVNSTAWMHWRKAGIT